MCSKVPGWGGRHLHWWQSVCADAFASIAGVMTSHLTLTLPLSYRTYWNLHLFFFFWLCVCALRRSVVLQSGSSPTVCGRSPQPAPLATKLQHRGAATPASSSSTVGRTNGIRLPTFTAPSRHGWQRQQGCLFWLSTIAWRQNIVFPQQSR